jgi:hypothetical protein
MTSERVCDDFLAFFAPSPDWSLSAILCACHDTPSPP